MITTKIFENGHEQMIVDCGDYKVEMFKSIDENTTSHIAYQFKNAHFPILGFNVNWDKEIEGGKITLKFRDRWGCEMIFIHYQPTPIKGMFDFIGKGYDVFKRHEEYNNKNKKS